MICFFNNLGGCARACLLNSFFFFFFDDPLGMFQADIETGCQLIRPTPPYLGHHAPAIQYMAWASLSITSAETSAVRRSFLHVRWFSGEMIRWARVCRRRFYLLR